MNASHNRFETVSLLVVVFTVGGAVMVLEILGSRILGPYFGAGLYVWSGIISVTLLSLALGYWLGGLLADRWNQLSTLTGLTFAAALLILLIPTARPLVLTHAGRLGFRPGVLVSAFLLFFPPLTLLGMVTPAAVKLHTRNLANLGLTAGRLYAVSTLGSLLGTLLTGFVLLPAFGTARVLHFTAGLLVLLALITGARNKCSQSLVPLVGLAVLLFPILGRQTPAGQMIDPWRVLHRSESLYGNLVVAESGTTRHLLVDGTVQSAIELKSRELVFASHRLILEILGRVAPARGQTRSRLLVVGLAGGVLPTKLSDSRWDIQIVEIDGRMPEVARDFFGWNPRRFRFTEDDGRHFLQTHTERFDAIVLDAFVGEVIPAHLLTRESFELARARLRPHGLLLLNTIAFQRGKSTVIPASIARTLSTAFSHVVLCPLRKEGNFGNIVFVAAGQERVPRPFAPAGACAPPSEVLEEPGIVLTDDRNPLETWWVKNSALARRALWEVVDRRVLFE
ncbi:MAG: fused MFS/spermidine synthase [Nitrospinota bacterium]